MASVDANTVWSLLSLSIFMLPSMWRFLFAEKGPMLRFWYKSLDQMFGHTKMAPLKMLLLDQVCMMQWTVQFFLHLSWHWQYILLCTWHSTNGTAYCVPVTVLTTVHVTVCRSFVLTVQFYFVLCTNRDTDSTYYRSFVLTAQFTLYHVTLTAHITLYLTQH